jgi:hypothetical protein
MNVDLRTEVIDDKESKIYPLTRENLDIWRDMAVASGRKLLPYSPSAFIGTASLPQIKLSKEERKRELYDYILTRIEEIEVNPDYDIDRIIGPYIRRKIDELPALIAGVKHPCSCSDDYSIQPSTIDKLEGVIDNIDYYVKLYEDCQSHARRMQQLDEAIGACEELKARIAFEKQRHEEVTARQMEMQPLDIETRRLEIHSRSDACCSCIIH